MAYYGLTEAMVPFFLFLLLMWIGKFYLDRRNLYRLTKMIPGPNGYPLIGSSLDFIENSREKTFCKLLKYFETNPETFKFWIGPKLMIGVSKPQDLEIILNHKECLAKDMLYDVLKPLTGDGIFTAPVGVWKKNRKLINPLFKQKILESFLPIFVKNANNLVNALEENVNSKSLEIIEKFDNCTISFMCEMIMGLNLNAQIESDHIGHWLDKVLPILLIRISNIFYQTDFGFRWTKYKKVHDMLLSKIHNYTMNMIIKQRQLLHDSKNNLQGVEIEDEDNDVRNTSMKSFLHSFLTLSEYEGQFTDEELNDEIITLIIGGTESSANTMSFCCLLLAMHPEIQQNVYEEVIQVIGKDGEVTADVLPRLQYLERCIKESMRIFPLIPLIMRTPTADITLENCTIPANSTILISIIHNHRNPKYWKEPLRFDPDRFLSEETLKRHPYSYIPFSAGPRRCIGFHLSSIVLKTILSKIVRKFILKTEYPAIEAVDLTTNLALRPVHGFKVWVEPRI